MDSRIALVSVLLVTGVHAQTVRIAGDTGAPLPVNPTQTANGVPVYLANTISGEDATNNVIKVEHQYSKCIDDADIVCKASAGFVHSVNCYGTDAAATAGRVRITNTTAAGGAEGTEVWGDEFAAAEHTPSGAILDIVMDTGIVIDFTTTADVKCVVSYR